MGNAERIQDLISRESNSYLVMFATNIDADTDITGRGIKGEGLLSQARHKTSSTGHAYNTESLSKEHHPGCPIDDANDGGGISKSSKPENSGRGSHESFPRQKQV